MNGKDSQAQASSNQTWAEALAEYEGEIRRRHFIVHWIGRVLFLSWAIFLIANPNLDWWYRLIGIGFLGWMVISQFQKEQSITPEIHALLNRVTGIGLAERTISGSLSNERIREYTSGMQRWLVPKLRPGNKLDLLKRVGASLEWYLVPPGSHYRGTWTAGLLGVLGLLMLIIALAMGYTNAILIGLSEEWGMLVFLTPMGLLVGLNPFDQQITLIRYFKDQWKEDSQNGSYSESGQHTVDSPGYILHRDYNIDLIINLCEKELDYYKGSIDSSTFLAYFVIGFSLSGKQVLPENSIYLLAIAMVGILLLWGLAKFLKAKSTALQKVYCEKLSNSKLVARIISGEATKAKLKAHIPKILSWLPESSGPSFLLPGGGEDISTDIVCVALNLDWYLERPRTLVRPMWVWFCLLLVIGAYVATEKVTSTSAVAIVPIWAWVMLYVTALAFWITLLQSSIRIRAGSLALIEHLREGRS